jgi:hypothetical protein
MMGWQLIFPGNGTGVGGYNTLILFRFCGAYSETGVVCAAERTSVMEIIASSPINMKFVSNDSLALV